MLGDRVCMLMVCRANVCRSPIAEALARHHIESRLGRAGTALSVSSAGTGARIGAPMHPFAAAVLDERGAGTSAFRTRRLTAQLVESADVILTATREERAACASLDPSAVQRTFPLLQFGRLAETLPPFSLIGIWPPKDRLRALLEEVAIRRGEFPTGDPEEDDLPDPMASPIDGFRQCALDIESAVVAIGQLIAPI